MLYYKRTKIVATIGPASDSEEQIKNMISAGVNVFRFNMKHNTHEWHQERIVRVRKVSAEMQRPIGVLIDLQGPELRINTFEKKPLSLKKGEKVTLARNFIENQPSLTISHPQSIDVLDVNDTFLINDGFIELTVVEKLADSVVMEAVEDCEINHYKGVNLPSKDIPVESLTADDMEKLNMAQNTPVDFIALSFVRSRHDVSNLRQEMKSRGIDADIISKIESQAALDHIDEIISATDGIMVARGDLGIEVPMEELAFWQTELITKCRIANKTVITATQMLQSMIDNSRPTRAEATDVANAVLDGTDAVMLSGESATGKYPVKCVQTLAKIAAFNETRTDLLDIQPALNDDTEMIIHGAVSMLARKDHPRIDAILIFTETGTTARTLARFHPNVPIIAVTNSLKTVSHLTLVYGVHTVFEKFPTGAVSIPNPVFDKLKDRQLIVEGERLLVIHGQHWNIPGKTNALALVTV